MPTAAGAGAYCYQAGEFHAAREPTERLQRCCWCDIQMRCCNRAAAVVFAGHLQLLAIRDMHSSKGRCKTVAIDPCSSSTGNITIIISSPNGMVNYLQPLSRQRQQQHCASTSDTVAVAIVTSTAARDPFLRKAGCVHCLLLRCGGHAGRSDEALHHMLLAGHQMRSLRWIVRD